MDALEYQLKKRILKLERKTERLQEALATFISWAALSVNSPINEKEVTILAKILEDEDDE